MECKIKLVDQQTTYCRNRAAIPDIGIDLSVWELEGLAQAKLRRQQNGLDSICYLTFYY